MATLQNKPCLRYGRENCEQRFDNDPCNACADNEALSVAIEKAVTGLGALKHVCADLGFNYYHSTVEVVDRAAERYPLERAA